MTGHGEFFSVRFCIGAKFELFKMEKAGERIAIPYLVFKTIKRAIMTRTNLQKGFLDDKALDALEKLLDRQLRLPGTQMRFGIDGLIGLIPGIGDVATAGLSSIIILESWKRGCRKRVLARMMVNLGLDAVLGSIPLLGDLFDFGFKANTKNLKLLREEEGRWAEAERLREQETVPGNH
jgi:hypothetical protein